MRDLDTSLRQERIGFAWNACHSANLLLLIMLLNELHTCPAETQSLVSPWRSNSSLRRRQWEFRHALIAWPVEKNVSGGDYMASTRKLYDGKFTLSTGWIPFVWHCVILPENFPEILETTGLTGYVGANLPEKVVILGERPHSPIRSLSLNCPGNLYWEASQWENYGGQEFVSVDISTHLQFVYLNTELLPLSKWGWTEPDRWQDGASRIFLPKTPKRSQTRFIFCPFCVFWESNNLVPRLRGKKLQEIYVWAVFHA